MPEGLAAADAVGICKVVSPSLPQAAASLCFGRVKILIDRRDACVVGEVYSLCGTVLCMLTDAHAIEEFLEE